MKSIKEYFTDTVLPALRAQPDDELMLKEFVRRWEIYKVMFRRLLHIFNYLDRFFDPKYNYGVRKRYNVSLIDEYNVSSASVRCFRELVLHELRDSVMNSVIVLVDKERDGEQFDCVLLWKVIVCIGEIVGTESTEYWPERQEHEVVKNDDRSSRLDRSHLRYDHSGSAHSGGDQKLHCEK